MAPPADSPVKALKGGGHGGRLLTVECIRSASGGRRLWPSPHETEPPPPVQLGSLSMFL